MYNTTAFLYESIGAFEVPHQVCDLLQDYFFKYGITPPATLGDFGSGTGLNALLLAERGWHIRGVELSQAMMAVAEEKTRTLPDEIQARLIWTQGDITCFQFPPGVQLDGAICLHNTINHLAEWSQVTGFIQTAYQALRPGGVLILDSDTLPTFLGFFNHGPVLVWDDGQHRLIRECAFDMETGRANHTATLEQYVNGEPVLVGTEPMSLQYHHEERLFDAFVEAGFQVCNAAPFNPNPGLYPEDMIPKILWVLRKPE